MEEDNLEIISPYAIPGLKRQFMPKRISKMNADEIVDTVCEYFGFDRKEISVKSRERKYVYARSLSAYLVRKHTKLSLNEVSKLFGSAITDHTTIIHYQKLINDNMDVHQGAEEDIIKIEKILRADNDIENFILPLLKTK